MKIVLAIGGLTEPLVYFANAIHAHFPIDLLIVENKPQIHASTPSIKQKPNVDYIEKTLKYILFRLERNRSKRLAADHRQLDHQSHQKWFNQLGDKLNQDIPILEVSDINSKETENALKERSPDFFMDHGTSLVKPNVLNLAKVCLNLHWGLSPYYRGVNCTERALINWDINNIGVTIHRLGENIDGGDILGQQRAVISAKDNIVSINSQLTYLGTEIMKRAIQKVVNGEELVFTPQKFYEGFLIKGMYWNRNMANFLNEIEENLLEKMLRFPSRGKAPIIEME